MKRAPFHSRAFTLTEMLVVMGLVAMLGALLLPVVSKARAAASSTNCLSNLRQMNTAWTMYMAENRGSLVSYFWRTPTVPEVAWYGYWPGILDVHGVRGESLICPSARERVSSPASGGYGAAALSWSGKFVSTGSTIRLNIATYRDGSYGFNRYLAAERQGFGEATKITAVRNPSDVPAFFDCAFVDVEPINGSESAPVQPPPNLTGDQIVAGSPHHWNFLLARHGRAINVSMADGSARRVPLEETYMLTWNANWAQYHIPLPTR